MSLTTAARELTRGQSNTCQVILSYHCNDPWTQSQPPVQRLGAAFENMMIMLDMSPAELSTETGVEERVIERLEWWGEGEEAGFLDVMHLAHFFDISLEEIEKLMFDYKGQRWSWR